MEHIFTVFKSILWSIYTDVMFDATLMINTLKFAQRRLISYCGTMLSFAKPRNGGSLSFLLRV